MHAKRDTEIEAPRFTAAQTADLIRRFSALENVPMFNLLIYQDGTLSPSTVEMMRDARAIVEGQRYDKNCDPEKLKNANK